MGLYYSKVFILNVKLYIILSLVRYTKHAYCNPAVTTDKRKDTHYQYQKWKKGYHLVPRTLKEYNITNNSLLIIKWNVKMLKDADIRRNEWPE